MENEVVEMHMLINLQKCLSNPISCRALPNTSPLMELKALQKSKARHACLLVSTQLKPEVNSCAKEMLLLMWQPLKNPI